MVFRTHDRAQNRSTTTNSWENKVSWDKRWQITTHQILCRLFSGTLHLKVILSLRWKVQISSSTLKVGSSDSAMRSRNLKANLYLASGRRSNFQISFPWSFHCSRQEKPLFRRVAAPELADASVPFCASSQFASVHLMTPGTDKRKYPLSDLSHLQFVLSCRNR